MENNGVTEARRSRKQAQSQVLVEWEICSRQRVAAASFRTSFSSGPVFPLRNDRTRANGNRLSGPRRTYFRSFDRRPAGPTSCPERSDSSHFYAIYILSYFLLRLLHTCATANYFHRCSTARFREQKYSTVWNFYLFILGN